MGRPRADISYQIYLDDIDAYLKRTRSSGSRLSEEATGCSNHISQMRTGRAVAKKHIRAILLYMQDHPTGPPLADQRGRKLGERFPQGYRTERRGRPSLISGSAVSTSIPVPGASQLPPDLFEAMKAEAFRKGMPVVRFMEEVVKLGWQQYQEVIGERDDRRGTHHQGGGRLGKAA